MSGTTDGHLFFLLYALEMIIPFIVFICVFRGKGLGLGTQRIISAIILWCIYIFLFWTFIKSDIVGFIYSFFDANYPDVFEFSQNNKIGMILLKLSHAIGITLAVILSYKYGIPRSVSKDE